MNPSSLLWVIRGIFPHFTDRTIDVLAAACRQAHKLKHGLVTPEHVLLGIAEVEPGVGCVALKNLGLELPRRVGEIAALVPATTARRSEGHMPSFSPETERLFAAAKSESKALGHNYVGTEHLILGLFSSPATPASEYLHKQGITPSQIREEIVRLLSV